MSIVFVIHFLFILLCCVAVVSSSAFEVFVFVYPVVREDFSIKMPKNDGLLRSIILLYGNKDRNNYSKQNVYIFRNRQEDYESDESDEEWQPVGFRPHFGQEEYLPGRFRFVLISRENF